MMDAAPPPVRNRNGTFAKGHKQLGHRGMGKVNKLTADIKSGMMHSAIAHGRDGHGAGGLDGFCEWLLKNDLRAWCGIFGRLVPLQVHGDVVHHGAPLQVNVITIPRGRHFTVDEARKVLAGELAPCIDVTPATIAEVSVPHADEPRAMNAAPLPVHPDGSDSAA